MIPEPYQRTVRTLPLIFVNGARQETLDIGVLGRDAAADHFSNRTGDDHAGFLGVQHLVRASQGTLGATLSQFFLSQTGYHDRQFVRGKGVGVVQHRGDGQILATHRAVNNHLQALDRREHVHRTPVAASAIVVED